MFEKISNKLQEPHTANALSIILGLASALTPAPYNQYVIAAAGVLVVLGMRPSASMTRKIQDLADANNLALPVTVPQKSASAPVPVVHESVRK